MQPTLLVHSPCFVTVGVYEDGLFDELLPKDQAFPMVKVLIDGFGRIICACFSKAGIRLICLCEGRMNQDTYKVILEENLLSSALTIFPNYQV